MAEQGFPIRVLADMTGVSAATLRAWERRYGLLNPQRSAGGHRLYSADDADLVLRVVRLLESDHPIGEAAEIVRQQDGEPPAPAARTAPPQPSNPPRSGGGPETSHWTRYRDRILRGVERFSVETIEAAYNEALSIYPIDMVTEMVVNPTARRLGERWHERPAGVAEEHFFTSYLRNKLGARLHHEAGRTSGTILLAACLPGEGHELGLLMFTLSAVSTGYRVVYLGPDLPLDQIEGVIAATRVHGVVCSGTQVAGERALLRALEQLPERIKIPCFAGGDFSEHHRLALERHGWQVLGGNVMVALARLSQRLPAHPVPD